MLEPVTQSERDSVPLYALREKTRNLLSQLLNCKKIIPTPDGLPRDWRGLAHLADIANSFNDLPNPTWSLLHHWEKQRPFPTISQLKNFLDQLDRWDILDDCSQSIEDDIDEYIRRKESGATDNQLMSLDADKEILTRDDYNRVRLGLSPQIYDAFLLFADEDSEHAKMIVDKLENEYGLKLCFRERDLVGGVGFEHDAIMRLISERCYRLIIIISPYFLDSPFNKFFVTYAQALGIEQRQRKIIPCTFQNFSIPAQLRHYFILNHNRTIFCNFWEKLSQSVSPPSVPQIQSATGTCTITEIPDPEAETRKIDEETVVNLKDEKTIQVIPPKRKNRPLSSFLKKVGGLFPDTPKDSPGNSKNTRTWLPSRKKKVMAAAS